jgi:hypothetical protein
LSKVLLLYVPKPLGHAKATTRLDHYAKLLPAGEQRLVKLLGKQPAQLGTKLT